MDKILALFTVLRAGESVANPEAWKKGQITVTLLGGFLVAAANAAKAWGYNVPLDMDTANAVATGALGVWNIYLTLATTKKVGL